MNAHTSVPWGRIDAAINRGSARLPSRWYAPITPTSLALGTVVAVLSAATTRVDFWGLTVLICLAALAYSQVVWACVCASDRLIAHWPSRNVPASMARAFGVFVLCAAIVLAIALPVELTQGRRPSTAAWWAQGLMVLVSLWAVGLCFLAPSSVNVRLEEDDGHAVTLVGLDDLLTKVVLRTSPVVWASATTFTFISLAATYDPQSKDSRLAQFHEQLSDLPTGIILALVGYPVIAYMLGLALRASTGLLSRVFETEIKDKTE